VLYVHDSTWRLRRGFAYATVPKKRKIAPAGCCTYMILRGDYGEASRMLQSPKKERLHLPGVVRTWFYVVITESLRVCYRRRQNIVCTIILTYGVHDPRPSTRRSWGGWGRAMYSAHHQPLIAPSLLVLGAGDRDVLHTRCYVWINIYRYQHIRQP
jgi:hypothetical protein